MQEQSGTRRRWPTWVIALALGAGATVVTEAREAGMYGTTNWTSACNANDLSFWDNMVDEWYQAIDDYGWYTHDRRWVDGSFSKDPMCDPDDQGAGSSSGCSDGYNLDEQDAVMVFGHGSDIGDHWGMITRNKGTDGSCWIQHPGHSEPAGRMYAGDYDAEFVHLSSCYSMDDDNMPNTWRAFRDPVDTPTNGRRLHQMTGFHGIMWIGNCCDDQYGDFAEDAHWNSVKNAWLQNMYVTGINGSATQCPVAYAVGANRDDCFARIDSERYTYTRPDPSAIGYYCYYAYFGCDPNGESPFGS